MTTPTNPGATLAAAIRQAGAEFDRHSASFSAAHGVLAPENEIALRITFAKVCMAAVRAFETAPIEAAHAVPRDLLDAFEPPASIHGRYV